MVLLILKQELTKLQRYFCSSPSTNEYRVSWLHTSQNVDKWLLRCYNEDRRQDAIRSASYDKRLVNENEKHTTKYGTSHK